MALSGTLDTNAYDGRFIRLTWSATQDVAANKSIVTWKLAALGGNAQWYTTGPITCSINGQTVYHYTGRTDMYVGQIIGGTIEIPHNSDGTKTFTATVSAAIYSASVNCIGTKDFTLNTINQVPGAPTSISATAGNGLYVSRGDEVIIQWSGAAGNIASYEVQGRWYRNGAWEGWGTVANVPATGGSGRTSVTISQSDILPGNQVQFRVRAIGPGGQASSPIAAIALTLVGGVRIRTDGSWKQGQVYIKVSGTWRPAKNVYIKVNGTWKESI